MPRHRLLSLLAFLLLSATSAGAAATLSPVASLGEKIFFDPTLSASGRMACATCHDPAKAFAQSNDVAVQSGGADLDVAGFRAVPSLRYMTDDRFFFDSEGTPTAGFNRDGRASSLVDQAIRPFTAAHEMATVDGSAVVAKLATADYAAAFRALFGNDAFDDPATAFLAAHFAIAAYERDSPAFHPFDSKYDYFLAGKVALSEQEMRGLVLYNNPEKGKCIGCHPSARSADGTPPLFTDYTYDNLGVPRNPEIPANADPSYFDLGLCGPERADLAARGDLCGAFKVPTLRNVATRHVFFHNGVFKTLHDAIEFYIRRDTNPEEFYPRDTRGAVMKFDDLPPDYHRNVNVVEVPYDRHPGEAPRLDAVEIDDLVAFLGTLTDGYDPITDTADPARPAPATSCFSTRAGDMNDPTSDSPAPVDCKLGNRASGPRGRPRTAPGT